MNAVLNNRLKRIEDKIPSVNEDINPKIITISFIDPAENNTEIEYYYQYNKNNQRINISETEYAELKNNENKLMALLKELKTSQLIMLQLIKDDTKQP